MKSSQIKTRKGSGKHNSSLSQVWALRPLTLCELRLLIQWCLEAEAITGWPHSRLHLVASTVWVSAPGTKSLVSLTKPRSYQLINYSEASVAITQPRLLLLWGSLHREPETYILSDAGGEAGPTARGERGAKLPRKADAHRDPCLGQC